MFTYFITDLEIIVEVFKAAPAQAQPSTFYFLLLLLLFPVSAKLLLLYYFADLLSPVVS